MSVTLRVLPHEYTEGRKEHSEMARGERSFSAVKDVLAVVLVNVGIALAIGMALTAIALSEVEFPQFISEFLSRPFSYM